MEIKKMLEQYKTWIWSAIAIVVCIIIGALCSGCTTTKLVPVIEHQTDTIFLTKYQRDSIWLHDSVLVQTNGDTLIIDRWHTKYVEKQIHDTTYIATHDTIPKPYPVEKKVPATLSWIQQAKQYLANLVLLLIAAVVIIFVGRRMLRL
jgi:hypothetical protein